jgi:hypothetical protein
MHLRSSESCSVGLDFQAVFHENDSKIVSVSLFPDHSKTVQFAVRMGEDSGHYVGCAEHPCQTCLTQVASDCGRQTPTFGHCSGVCELRTADRVPESSLRHCLTLRRIASGDGASCRFISWRNSHSVYITNPVHNTHTHARAFSYSPTPHVD